MGTSYSVKYYPSSYSVSENIIYQDIEVILEQVNQQMSTYRTDSDISNFNNAKIVNQPISVALPMILVVKEAMRISQLTEGKFDITIGPLVNLWGFGPEKTEHFPPTENEIRQRKMWTGMDKIHIDGLSLVKSIPEVNIDLSAIAKGYAVDAVGEYLESHRINDYLVEIGGEIRVRGNNNQQQWKVAIEKPDNLLLGQAQRIVTLNNLSMATSGNYRNYIDAEGIRYSHTIDPDTGRPITHKLLSITVFSPKCMTADGLATGLAILEPEKSLAIANQLDIPVYMLIKSGNDLQEHYSVAFSNLFIDKPQ